MPVLVKMIATLRSKRMQICDLTDDSNIMSYLVSSSTAPVSNEEVSSYFMINLESHQHLVNQPCPLPICRSDHELLLLVRMVSVSEVASRSGPRSVHYETQGNEPERILASIMLWYSST